MNPKRWGVIGVLTLTLGLAFGLSPVFAAKGNGDPPRKIVVFNAEFQDAEAQEALVNKAGATPLRSLPLINGFVALVPSAAQASLADNQEVARVDDDVVVLALAKPDKAPGGAKKPKDGESPPAQSLPWGVDRVDADLTGNNTGAGVKVAVVDTGIDLKHSDLSVKGGVNTINPRKSANDDNGHGTHVAGTIAALDNDIGVVGVAPDAHLYAVKVLDRNGSGFLSDVIEGITWAINNGIQVVNLSLGTSADIQSFHDAIIAADNAGIVIVAAAGNNGGSVIYPAAYDETIAVSATDNTDALAGFSSRGPEVTLAAPGVDVPSTWKGDSYKTISGTSMATPHVTGSAALAIARRVADVQGTLESTADDLGAAGRDDFYGHGLVDAEEAATGTQTNP